MSKYGGIMKEHLIVNRLHNIIAILSSPKSSQIRINQSIYEVINLIQDIEQNNFTSALTENVEPFIFDGCSCCPSKMTNIDSKHRSLQTSVNEIIVSSGRSKNNNGN